MSTTPTRMRRSSTATTGRFSRGRTTPRRRTTPQRRMVAGGWLQRRQPKQSAVKRMLGGVSGAMPRRGGKAGGLAVLAGAAGLLFKNRDKVSSMVRRDDGEAMRHQHAGPTPVTTTGGAGDVPKV